MEIGPEAAKTNTQTNKQTHKQITGATSGPGECRKRHKRSLGKWYQNLGDPCLIKKLIIDTQ